MGSIFEDYKDDLFPLCRLLKKQTLLTFSAMRGQSVCQKLSHMASKATDPPIYMDLNAVVGFVWSSDGLSYGSGDFPFPGRFNHTAKVKLELSDEHM